MGVPIEGAEKICEAMTNLLQNTHHSLEVTHLCVDLAAIERIQDEAFQNWVEANYEAVTRGVSITRIFIVHKSDLDHSVLVQVEARMRSKGVNVLVCCLDDLRPRLREDFSIYDGEHLVYMDRARVYWSSTHEQEPLARRTESREKIVDYKNIFESLENAAKK